MLVRNYEILAFLLSSKFIYEPFLLKYYMNTNNMKAQIYLFKYDLRGH